jgi:hypothetical protein
MDAVPRVIARMDMDMDMGGHSMGTNGFQPRNIALAQGFWYIIVGVMGFLAGCRVVHLYASQRRLVSLLPTLVGVLLVRY